MCKPCNSCDSSVKVRTKSGDDIFFLCEALDCRMSNADYVKDCKHKKPKKYNRKEFKENA